MFCDEHGTIDYCPECLKDGIRDDELKMLRECILKVNVLERSLQKRYEKLTGKRYAGVA